MAEPAATLQTDIAKINASTTAAPKTDINREHKDRLFKFLFGNPEHKDWTLSLYNALNGTSYTNPEDITFTTIQDAVYMSMKNDVSLLLADTMPDDSLIKPFIIANKAEVRRMFITEYNEAATMDKFKREYLSQGDYKRMVRDAKGMYKEGMLPEAIARVQETTVDVIETILGLKKA